MRIPQRPPRLEALSDAFPQETWNRILANLAPTTPDGKYRHWETIRRMRPPDGLTSKQWWLATKFARMSMRKPLPLNDASGERFYYSLPDAALEMLHRIDQRISGEIAMGEVVTNPATRDRYLVSSLIEEAITSSQLEGAMTSRAVAKEMLRTGRPPRDHSERMILNNFHAIQFVREHRSEALTPELVCQVQRIVTEDTLDDPWQAGRVQIPTDERVCVETLSGEIVHRPPPASELPDRMEAMCEFANGVNYEGFVHPVVRAILLHFWLAYDHPFADGNGRTARALFYWSMLRQEYWLAEYLSISRILRDAPAQYGRSFLYTETDDNDATYLLLYQLKVICRAICEFYDYLKRKAEEVQEIEQLIKSSVALNHRQLALLSHALRHPGHSYTFRSHATSHNVVRQSARSDLLDLEARGLLTRRLVGRAYTFQAPPDLVDRLRALADDPGVIASIPGLGEGARTDTQGPAAGPAVGP